MQFSKRIIWNKISHDFLIIFLIKTKNPQKRANKKMERIYSQVKNETNKYSDISNVYQKLQDSGYIKLVYDLFQQIFLQEKRYTYEEITKIMQSYPNKKINLDSQLKLNGAIFKTNFHLIVDIIIDMIASDVYNAESNNPYSNANSMSELGKLEKLGSSQKSLNTSWQKLHSPSNKSPNNSSKNINLHRSNFNNNTNSNSNNNNNIHNNANNSNNPNIITVTQSATLKKASKPPSNNKERKNPRLESAKISPGLSTSVVVTRNDAKAFKKKKFLEKADQNNQNNAVNITTNMSFYSQKNPRLNQSTNSLYSQSLLYPNLDSEFSYIGGKSTFSFPKTERMKDPKDASPGPIYEIGKANEIVRKKSPDVKFDKAEKTSWFDEKFKQGSMSPGYIYNPSKHFTTK